MMNYIMRFFSNIMYMLYVENELIANLIDLDVGMVFFVMWKFVCIM